MVRVFTSSTCAVCPTVKKYLSHKGIDYKEISVETDEGRLEYSKVAPNERRVPVATDGERVVVGYNPGLLAKLA